MTVVISEPAYAVEQQARIDYARGSHMPLPKEGEVAKPYVLGLREKIRCKADGKLYDNPHHEAVVFGLSFPSALVHPDAYIANPAETSGGKRHRTLRPTLPVVKLTDSQLAAVWKRAKESPWGCTMNSPWPGALPIGRHDGTVDELIVIAPYENGKDVFELVDRVTPTEGDLDPNKQPEDPNKPAVEMRTEFMQAMTAPNEESERPAPPDPTPTPKDNGNGKPKKH